jgi:hypothetical protein
VTSQSVEAPIGAVTVSTPTVSQIPSSPNQRFGTSPNQTTLINNSHSMTSFPSASNFPSFPLPPTSSPPTPTTLNSNILTSNAPISDAPSSTPDDPRGQPPWAIVGVALGSLAAIIAILFIVFYYHRRKRTKRKEMAELLSPTTSGSYSDRNNLTHENVVPPDDARPTGWVITSDSKMDIPPPAYTL